VDWQQRSFSVPAGTHTLKWQYDKDLSVNAGSDCGWVDQVSWRSINIGDAAAGVAFESPLPGEFAAASNVRLRGLPSGLRYNASTGLITGVPTRAGTYTVTVTAAGVGPETFEITVEALPDWAHGNFSGWVSTLTYGPGLATMSVRANGRIAGRLLLAGRSYTFSAPAYQEENEDGIFRFETDARMGRDVIRVAFSVHPPSVGAGAFALLSHAEGTLSAPASGEATLHRNIWKDAGAATTLAPYIGYYTAALPPGGDGFGSGFLAFTVDRNGNVRTAGRLADGTSVSCSGPLIMDGDGRFWTVIYTAPRPYQGGVFFGLAEFVRDGARVYVRPLDGEEFYWESLNATATGIFGTGFIRALGLAGGWYDRLVNLQTAYANGLVVDEVELPALWDEVSPGGLVLAVNTRGFTADRGEANPSALNFRFNRNTGVFSGGFRTVYENQRRNLPYQGILIPGREDPVDGMAGRGYYLWREGGENDAGRPYNFNRSFDFLLLDNPAD